MRCVRLRVLVLGLLAQHFLGAVETRQRFRQLRADADHLEHRRHQEGQVRGERERSRPAVSVAAPEICRAPTYITVPPTMPISTVAERLISDMAVSDAARFRSSRCTPPAKHARLARLRVISLHHAHAGQRFRQPAGDLRVDLAALAENRPDLAERLAQAQPEHRATKKQRDAGHQRADLATE